MNVSCKRVHLLDRYPDHIQIAIQIVIQIILLHVNRVLVVYPWLAALPNSNHLNEKQGGSSYHFYGAAWYDPAGARAHGPPQDRRACYSLRHQTQYYFGIDPIHFTSAYYNVITGESKTCHWQIH